MQPGVGRRGEDGCKDQANPPATGHLGRGREAPPPSSPPFLSPERPSEELQKHEHEDEQEQQPAVSLPEDALVEILSRVPYRSLCRFKCVSKPWLALCSAKDIRRRSPQTLSGFFHFDIPKRSPHTLYLRSIFDFDIDRLKFHNLSGTGRGPPMVDPSLRFLRERYERAAVKQLCSSLLLCVCWKSASELDKYDYVVCNPATEKWTVLPMVSPDGRLVNFSPNNIFLGFDTAAPSGFVVFAPQESCFDGLVKVVEVAIYSSETGRWTFVQSQWGDETTLFSNNTECIFLNGIMHLTTMDSSLATVDAAGKVWRNTKMPENAPRSCYNTTASIGQSQGHVYAWQIDTQHDFQLNIWVLEDYESRNWTLKHSVNTLELFGRHHRKDTESYKIFAIHPECNVIFLTDGEEMTVSYDIDNQKVHVLSTSREFLDGLPYAPCFAEWQSYG